MSEDMHDKLMQDFSQTGQITKGPDYSHPFETEIVRDAVKNLTRIAEGQRLLPLIKDLNLSIRVMIGKEPGVVTPDGNTVMLIMPRAIQSVNPNEIAVNLGIGLKESELNVINIQRLSNDPQLVVKKAVDVIIEMCRLVSGFHDVDNDRKLVDLLEKLGHSEIYKLYRSKASYQEMFDQVVKSIT